MSVNVNQKNYDNNNLNEIIKKKLKLILYINELDVKNKEILFNKLDLSESKLLDIVAVTCQLYNNKIYNNLLNINIKSNYHLYTL